MEKRKHLLKYATDALTFVVEVVEGFIDDNCPQLAAALAYYAIFSIPPLLVLIVAVIGTFLDAATVSEVIWESTSSFLTPNVGQQLISMLERANHFAQTGPWWSVVLSVFGVLFGATRGFNELQLALNRAWSIQPDPAKSALKTFLVKRLLSFAMVAATIIVLVLLIIASAFLAFFGEQLDPFIPDFVGSAFSWGSAAAVSLLVTSGVLAAIYRYLPDTKIKWSQVLPGAIFAAILFLALQSVTAFYFGQLKLNDTFGQAGSFALLLVWLYLCAMVVFLGAEFAQVWSRRRGNPVNPEAQAVQERRSVADLLASKLQKRFEALQ